MSRQLRNLDDLELGAVAVVKEVGVVPRYIVVSLGSFFIADPVAVRPAQPFVDDFT
jgi:hypothetical protein